MQSDDGAGNEHRQPSEKARCLFMMWEPHRKSLVASHLFYMHRGEEKLLSQFENMGQEATQAADDWLERNSRRFDPDRDDPGSFEEDAYGEGVEFYRLLSELRDQTILSMVAGIFQNWDKELRSWLTEEFHRWCRSSLIEANIWSANFDQIIGLVKSLGLAQPDAEYLKTLSACRYVVNVYKHGKGSSLQSLKENHPEFFPRLADQRLPLDLDFIDHRYLAVTTEQLRFFSDAVVGFWMGVPEKIHSTDVDEVPDWLVADRANRKKRGAKPTVHQDNK